MATQLGLRVFLAGRVAVESDSAVIDEARFAGRQGRLVFAYLAAEHGRPVPKDELAEALWGEDPPPSWDKALTGIVSKLRALLAAGGVDGAGALTGAFGCYRLDLPEGTWIDVIAAASAIDEAEAALAGGDVERARTGAALAESLTRATFLPGEDGVWVNEKRRDLSEVRLRALVTLADACLRSGEAREAARWAEQSVALAPFRESGYGRLMEAHVAAGNRAEALQVYERCRRFLAEELGAYPSSQLEAAYRELLERPSVEVPEAAAVEPGPAAGGAARHPVRRRRVVAAGAIVGCLAVTAGALLAGRGGSAGALVAPDSVGLLAARGGQVVSQIAVGQAPSSIAVGAGSVWTTDTSAGTVARIDPESRVVRQTIAVGASPGGIAVGGGGVWVANHDDDSVSWINPESNAVVRTIHVGAGPTAVAYGFGSVWVANVDDRTVTRIAAASGKVAGTIRTDAEARAIAVGAGSVWVTDESTGSVLGIDPATNLVTSRAPVGAGPTGVAYGDGSLWVVNSLDDTVTRLDPTTLRVRATIPVAGGPSSVVVDRGAVWVGAEFGARIVHIEPRHDDVVASTPIGSRPEGLAAGSGGVWVAAQSSGEGHRGGRLLVLGGKIDSIDPGVASFSVPLLATAYDGLVGFRQSGGAAGTEFVPDLAAALPRPTTAGTSFTFHLRPGTRYSDGRPLRAVDFRRALARDLELNGPAAPFFAQFAGAAGCIAHRRCDLSRSVFVEGPSTLTFRLPAPDPRFFWELTGLVPVPAGTPLHDVGTEPIPSTGPYAIESYAPGRAVTLVRNRHFRVWSAAAQPNGYPDEIVYRMTRDDGTAVRAVLAGRADVLLQADLGRQRVQTLAARHPLRLHLDAQQATAFVFLNVRRPPFDDVRVRRALDYAIDRGRIASLHGAALAQPTCQLVPPTDPGYRPYCPYTVAPDASGAWKAPDLAKARALIRASGTRGQTVVVWSFSYFGPESRYFVELLRRLGYRARLHYVPDIAAYFAGLQKTPSAQAGFAGWFGVPLAVDVLEEAGCRPPNANWAHFCDPHVDAQLERLEREMPGPARTAALAATIDREVTNAAPWLPLFTPRLPDVTAPRVGNYEDENGRVLLDQLWIR